MDCSLAISIQMSRKRTAGAWGPPEPAQAKSRPWDPSQDPTAGGATSGSAGPHLDASSVAIAIGYGPDKEFVESAPFESNQWHLVEVNSRTGQTNIPYVFAGGDAINGADLVVTAIADGKRASTWLHSYLLGLEKK